MSRYLSRAVLVSIAASFCCAAFLGCDGRPKRIYPPKINAAKAGPAAMEMYDANHDGKLDAEELKKVPSLAALARESKDGVVTESMITELLKRWTEGRVGRVSWGMRFLHNNKSLEGATVQLVPEKFLGIDLKIEPSKTDNNGNAGFTVAVKSAEDPKGIPLGFYRIEVTKDGESIPAKYNTETILGIDVMGAQAGNTPQFNLVY
jgi:hypothetical protein